MLQKRSHHERSSHHHCHSNSNRRGINNNNKNSCSTRTSRSKTSPSNNHHYNSSKSSKKTRSRSASTNSSSQNIKNDEDGHLVYRTGDWLRDRRYYIKGLLGEGTFGKCLECFDKKHDKYIALKVIKNIEKYREAAKLEAEVLKKLVRKDPENKYHCIQLLGVFSHGGHVCIAFPKLGKSVFDFMKENLYQPYPLAHVQHIAHQLLVSVNFLHSIKLTHTDLKPENMLFTDSAYSTHWSSNARQDIHVLKKSDIQLIDFGSATFEHEHHTRVVSTRHYRAPEVVLELGWSYPCDVWSCGCIIFELYTGNTLFQTHDNKEHLAMMQRILGNVPQHMIQKLQSSKKTKYFKGDKLDWDVKSRAGEYVNSNCRPLKEYLEWDWERTLVRDLYDLLKKMLEYDPKQRITATDALSHPFFKVLEVYKNKEPHSRASSSGSLKK